jgi:hypothetical protein
MTQMDEEDFKIHQCSSLPKEGVEVIFSRNGIDGYDSVWNLIIRRESTETDLENNHYLEEAGETIWETILEISHCPYCGDPLDNSGTICEGKFIHRDCSGYSMKIL